MRNLFVRGLFVLSIVLAFAACGSNPPSDAVPADFDLSGQWTLLPDRSDPPPKPVRIRARGGPLHLVLADFPVLEARHLQIEQDRFSMSILHDESAWRDVSWGSRQRGLWEVRAGWLDGALVILSKAEDADARESYDLSADRRVLTITLEIRSHGETLSLVRTFGRT